MRVSEGEPPVRHSKANGRFYTTNILLIMPAPKYPRVLVTAARHASLVKESKKLKITIAELVEKKFKSAK